MAKHELSFIELHNPLFVQTGMAGQGMNLGNKITPESKGARAFWDDSK